MDHLQHSIKHIVDNVNKVVIFFWKKPTSRKCYYAKWFKFKPQSHISLATFPNLRTSLEVFEIHIDICRWKARCWNGFYWVSLFGCTIYERGGGNGIVRDLGYICKWQRCDNETPKWKWFGKMIHLYFCGSPRYGSFWIIVFKIPKMKVENIWTMNLPIKENAKQFGVGLKA